MKMSHERIEFGSNLMDELEKLLAELNPKSTDLDLSGIVAYMEHIRGKMIAQYYWQGEDREILAQIVRMQNCVDSVRKLIKTQDASAM